MEISIAARPASGHHRYNYAVSLAEAGRAGDAEEQYREAIVRFMLSSAARCSDARLRIAAPQRLGPRETTATSYNNLGNLLVNGGRRGEAAACFRGAIEASPTHAMAHNNFANVVRDGGDDGSLRAAGRLYAAAVHLSPQYAEACTSRRPPPML
jgi:tetratricopeptide (TPR) repeat protein